MGASVTGAHGQPQGPHGVRHGSSKSTGPQKAGGYHNIGRSIFHDLRNEKFGSARMHKPHHHKHHHNNRDFMDPDRSFQKQPEVTLASTLGTVSAFASLGSKAIGMFNGAKTLFSAFSNKGTADPNVVSQNSKNVASTLGDISGFASGLSGLASLFG